MAVINAVMFVSILLTEYLLKAFRISEVERQTCHALPIIQGRTKGEAVWILSPDPPTDSVLVAVSNVFRLLFSIRE